MNKKLYDNIIRNISILLKHTLNESFFDTEEEIDDYVPEIKSYMDLKIFGKNNIILEYNLYQYYLRYDINYIENQINNLINLVNAKAYKVSTTVIDKEDLSKDYTESNLFTVDYDLDPKNLNRNNMYNIALLLYIEVPEFSNAIDFKEYFIKFFNDARSTDILYLQNMYVNYKNVNTHNIRLRKILTQSEKKYIISVAKKLGYKKWDILLLDGVDSSNIDKDILTLKMQYSFFNDMNLVKENGKLYIVLDENKNFYSFTKGLFMRAINGSGVSIKPCNINTLELRSGMSMENGTEWPTITEFAPFISYFKNCKIDKLILNRVYITKEGMDILYNMDINSLRFSESKLLLLKEPIRKSDFKNPNIVITSDKATFAKKYLIN